MCTDAAPRDRRERAFLTADAVVLAGDPDDPRVLLVRRAHPPFAGRWALPGGHVEPGEEPGDASRRELREETGLDAHLPWLVGAYATPGRDPRGRYVTWAYLCYLSPRELADVTLAARSDAAEATWVPVLPLLDAPRELAFDHGRLLLDAVGLARRLDLCLPT
jgi:8-oxo-dGTP diphosphatase